MVRAGYLRRGRPGGAPESCIRIHCPSLAKHWYISCVFCQTPKLKQLKTQYFHHLAVSVAQESIYGKSLRIFTRLQSSRVMRQDPFPNSLTWQLARFSLSVGPRASFLVGYWLEVILSSLPHRPLQYGSLFIKVSKSGARHKSHML